MCNTSLSDVDTSIRKGRKRKADNEEFDEIFVPPKRISPFLNTPKEKREERKKVLKTSIQKLQLVEDPEIFLRRSVLINNTIKRLQKEVREEKVKQPKYGLKNRNIGYAYGLLTNNCLTSSYMYDDTFICNAHEKITDDMTETLMSNLRDKLGDSPNSDQEVVQDSESKPEVVAESANENIPSDSKLSKCNCSSRALCSQDNTNAFTCSSCTHFVPTDIQQETRHDSMQEDICANTESSCHTVEHVDSDIRTTYISHNDNTRIHVSESFIINQTVLPCSGRLDINMILEPEVTSHSEIKSSAEYSRSQPLFLDGIYAY